jgi:hypothetical protein
MDRRDLLARLPRPAAWAPAGLFGALLLLPLGCAHAPETSRLQAADETEHDRYGVKTVGDVSVVGNAQPVRLGGVGLVVGLEGTGGDVPHGDPYRAMLEDQLRKQKVEHVKDLLASADCALVLVSAQLPPGAHRGDPIDVEVALPPHSRASGLRGGYLKCCCLYDYDFKSNLSPKYTGPNVALAGHKLARAEGPLLVGFGDGDEASREKRGRIWGGGRCLEASPFTLALKPDQQYARVASLVADRVNATFRAALPGDSGTEVAHASNAVAVALQVPAQYKLNLPRFLRVVRAVPLGEAGPAGGEDRRPYRQRLASDLLDPSRTVTAALRLEALGEGSVPALKAGLESPHPLVRFCAAESLAYLGSPSAGEELTRAADRQPSLRAFALTALASLDEAVSRVKLRELLAAADDETRYGAFRALHALDEQDEAVRGELLGDSFWLHHAAPGTAPLVHLTASRRAEVVLFGEEPFLKAPFSFLAGDFTFTAAEDDTHCTVTRVPLRGAPSRRQCSLRVDEVLHTLADLGGSYPEAFELLQQAHRCQCLSCRVRCDALPQAVSVYDLVKAGRGEAGSEDVLQVAPIGQDLGLTPTLYETGRPAPAAPAGDDEGPAPARSGAAAKAAGPGQAANE